MTETEYLIAENLTLVRSMRSIAHLLTEGEEYGLPPEAFVALCTWLSATTQRMRVTLPEFEVEE